MVLDDLLHNYSFDNPGIWGVLIASAVAFGFGYWTYIYAILIVIREKRSPYPNWMHTFYLACDATGTVFWFLMAREHDWFWFFSMSSVAMFIWVLCEIYCLYMAVKYERQETYGAHQDGPVTPKQATGKIVGEVIVFLTVVNLTNYFFGGLADAAMFKWYVWTNLMVPLGVAYYALRNRDGRISPVGLNVMILCATTATWLPAGLGMWTAASDYFNTAWFYIAGVVATGVAIHNVVQSRKFPRPEKRLPARAPALENA
jgi:hypothetical protein